MGKRNGNRRRRRQKTEKVGSAKEGYALFQQASSKEALLDLLLTTKKFPAEEKSGEHIETCIWHAVFQTVKMEEGPEEESSEEDSSAGSLIRLLQKMLGYEFSHEEWFRVLINSPGDGRHSTVMDGLCRIATSCPQVIGQLKEIISRLCVGDQLSEEQRGYLAEQLLLHLEHRKIAEICLSLMRTLSAAKIDSLLSQNNNAHALRIFRNLDISPWDELFLDDTRWKKFKKLLGEGWLYTKWENKRSVLQHFMSPEVSKVEDVADIIERLFPFLMEFENGDSFLFGKLKEQQKNQLAVVVNNFLQNIMSYMASDKPREALWNIHSRMVGNNDHGLFESASARPIYTQPRVALDGEDNPPSLPPSLAFAHDS